MSIAIAASLSLLLSGSNGSLLDASAARSDYRLLYMVAPRDKPEPYDIEDFPYVILADARSIRRINERERSIRLVHIRHKIGPDDLRSIIAYHDINVKCGADASIGYPTYENMSGVMDDDVNQTWNPSIPRVIVDSIFDIVCSTSKPGTPLGSLSRDALVNLLSDRPLDGRFTSTTNIIFPRRATQKEIYTGHTNISCTIDRSQEPKDCNVVSESIMNAGFGDEAINAISLSKYQTNNFGTINFRIEFSSTEGNSVAEVVEP